MPYYPKSRIITGLKASPGQFNLSNGKEYIGFYYITFDGLTKLIVKSETDIINPTNRNTLIFDLLNDKNIDIKGLLEPQSYYPIPTDIDYNKKNITRYFAQQRIIRKFKIIEINKETYEDIYYQRGVYNYPMWKVTSLFWQISGPLEDEKPNGILIAGVTNTNRRILDIKEKTFQGIKQYLTDLKQFYKA